MTENLDRAMGRIEGKIDRICADIEHDRKKRSEQYQSMEKLERKLENSLKSYQSINKRLEKVAVFNKWRERAIECE